MAPQIPDARTRQMLATAGWSETYRRDSSATGEQLVNLGFVFPDAARRFLDRYGDLAVYADRIMPQSNRLLFHTDPIEVAIHVPKPALARWEAQVGARLCPVASAAYGEYRILMDEHERSFGIDELGQMTFWCDLGDELIEMLCGYGPGFRPVDEDDRTPPK